MTQGGSAAPELPLSEQIEDLDVRIAEARGRDAEQAAFNRQQEFQALGEGRYRLTRTGVVLEVDYLERSGGVLKGEVMARTSIPGTRAADDELLAIEQLNLSSTRTRKGFAKYLEERSRLREFDWTGLLETFCQRVLEAERRGDPAVSLASLPRPAPDETMDVLGMPLLARHPLILFGDGGTAKSYLALFIAGTLARRGRRVAYFDWELAGEDHRDRLERIFGDSMPLIHYARCSRPFHYDRDRVRRITREHQIEYAIFDSISFACDGPPEAAEVAGRYFQALRSLGPVGSLHIAHVRRSRPDAPDPDKPFGSAFWANGARSTWSVKQARGAPDSDTSRLALQNQKANMGARRGSLGIELQFFRSRTQVRRFDLSTEGELAASLTTRERIFMALREGPMSRADLQALIVEEAADSQNRVTADTVRRQILRAIEAGQVIEFPGGDDRIALVERRRDDD